MENIADGVHPLTHFTHFAALWFGEGPLPRGRKKICQQRQKHEASLDLIRDNCERLPCDGTGGCVQSARGRMQDVSAAVCSQHRSGKNTPILLVLSYDAGS